MKKLKKLSALALAIMMIAVVGLAYAVATELAEDGEEGVAGQFNGGTGADTPEVKDDSINIKKEIIAFNPNGDGSTTTVYAPVITYTYTVTPATVSNYSVTDEDDDHLSGSAVVAPVNAGIIDGLAVTGANAAGTAVPGTTTANSASATLVFDNTSTWTTGAAGAKNEYDIKLDFTNVTFTQPGIYRYQIVETISADSYAAVAMEDGANDTLYLDVYVDGNLDIYGYVCMTTNGSVTPATNTKVNGFVEGTAIDNADKYYTYDLTLSKDVVNDTYAATNTAFPFTVFFNNNESYTSTFVIGQTVGTGSTGLGTSNPATLTLAANAVALSGVALVKDGNATQGTTVGDITFTGIPAGVDVDVYETNIVTGVTYTVETSVNGGAATTDNNVIAGSTPGSAVAQGASKADYESTKATVDTTLITSVASTQTVAITNTLLLISPTGLVLRFAPYALILLGGIALLFIAMKRKGHKEED